MKIQSIKLKNVKSFQKWTKIKFDDKFNLLIGPNGGGKSNLLDILNVVLKHFFLKSYTIDKDQTSKFFRAQNPFADINSVLEKFHEDNSDSYIFIKLKISTEDIENIKTISNNKELFKTELKKYRQDNIPDLELPDDMYKNLREGQVIEYAIKNNQIVGSHNNLETLYLVYLNTFEFYLYLIRDLNKADLQLYPLNLFFSPYRGHDSPQLKVTTSENYWEQLVNYQQSTSRKMTNLTHLATLHFARKRRAMEHSAQKTDYTEDWVNDTEVKTTKHYLNRIGYDWDLKCTDTNTNEYEIFLTKEGDTFRASQASSGEKEIINFLLGIFAFHIRGGLIFIDEPELHLHPRWQNLLIDIFLELSEITKNQFIICTHSPVFVNQKTLHKLIRIYKDQKNTSNTAPLDKKDVPEARDILHIVHSLNNEKMFFADKVILVEGPHDRLVYTKLLQWFNKFCDNKEIIEIIETGGKSYLHKYKDFLNKIQVKNYIIADQDFLLEMGDPTIKSWFITNYQGIATNIINAKKSLDGEKLAKELEEAINKNDTKTLKEFWGYISGRKRKLKTLSLQERQQLKSFIKSLCKKGLFILENGEIEYYLPPQYRKLDKTIQLLSSEEEFNNWAVQQCITGQDELKKIFFSILKAGDDANDALEKFIRQFLITRLVTIIKH